MRVAGICHVCGKPCMTMCSGCGMITCDECLDSINGVCPNCAPAEIYNEPEDDEDKL